MTVSKRAFEYPGSAKRSLRYQLGHQIFQPGETGSTSLGTATRICGATIYISENDPLHACDNLTV